MACKRSGVRIPPSPPDRIFGRPDSAALSGRPFYCCCMIPAPATPSGQKKSADGESAVNSNELAERLGKSAFYSAEIIGENILRSMSANKLTILSCLDL